MPVLGAMPLLPIASPQCVEASSSMIVQDGDVFVCSYPKSGTTWTQNIIATLLAVDQVVWFATDLEHRAGQGIGLDEIKHHVSEYTPFFDIDAHWDITAPHTPGRPSAQLVTNWEKTLKGIVVLRARHAVVSI
eukprot:2734445-Rhodomonas_salina.4